MNKKIENIKPRFYIGLVILLAEIITVPLVINPFREQFGRWATIGTQLIVLLFAILPPIIFKWDLRKVFPLKKPMIRQIFGVVILCISSIVLSGLASWTMIYFLPQIESGMQEIDNVTMGVPFFAAFIITVILPPVFEELLHRGTILYTFSGVKNKWLKVAALGVMFGAFHTNLSQFAGTSVMGMFLVYIMTETNNLFLPMLLHFLNNASASLVTPSRSLSEPAVSAAFDPNALFAIGNFLVLTAFIIFLIVWAGKLLHSKDYNREHKLGKKAKWVVAISSAFCFVTGICISFLAVV